MNSRCAVETGLDDLSEKLAVDPITLRLANLLPPHSATITGFRVTSIGMRECLERVKEASGWDEKFRKMPLGKGIGIGCGFFISGSGLPIHWDPNDRSTCWDLINATDIVYFPGTRIIGATPDDDTEIRSVSFQTTLSKVTKWFWFAPSLVTSLQPI